MPFLSAIGNVAHGVGGGYASVNNQSFSQGGSAGWLDDEWTGFVNGAANWTAAKYSIRTGEVVPLGGQANHAFAGGGHMAWFLAVSGPERGLYSTTGFRSVDGGLMGMGPDGAIAYKPLYHSNGPTHVRELNGDDWKLCDTAPQYTQLLGNRQAVWTSYQHTVHAVSFPQPIYDNTGGVWKFMAARAGNNWWGSYFSGKRGVVLHPFDSFMGYSVAPKGDAWHTIGALTDSIIRFAISAGEGEYPGEIWVRDYDVVNNLVRNPWGNHDLGEDAWVPATLVDIRTINQEAPGAITPINRPHWLGFYTGQPGAEGGWDTNNDPAGPPPPGNGYLDVPSGAFYDKQNQMVGRYVTGGTVEIIEGVAREVAAAGYTPICYWDANDWPRWPDLPNGSWLCQRGYCPSGWSPAQLENYLIGKLDELQRTRPGQKVAVVGQCYTSNDSLTKDIAGLVSVYSRVVTNHSNVIATIPFNGNGRTTGLQDHPEVRSLWDDYAASIPSSPPIEKPEDPMKEPEVTVVRWTLNELLDGREFIFEDTKNPELGYKARVSVRGGSMYAEFTNKAGTASTGAARPVKPCPPPIDPNPDPDPDPIPIPDRFYLRTTHGTYVYVGPDHVLFHGTKKTAFEIEDLSLRPENPFVGKVALKAKSGYTAAEPPDGEMQADRGDVGNWEKFTQEVSTVDPAQVCFKADSTGKYVAAMDSGAVQARQPEPLSWESFLLEPAKGAAGGGDLPKRRGVVRLDGYCFVDDGGRFMNLNASLFAALYLLKFEPERLRENLAFLSQHDFTCIRVLGNIGENYWWDRPVDMRWPDHEDLCKQLTDMAFDEYGLRVQWTLFGGTRNAFCPTDDTERQLVDRMINVYQGREEKVCFFEIGNESWQTGFGHPEGTQRLRDLARRLVDGLNARGLHVPPIAITSPAGPEAYGQPATNPDGSDNWEFGYKATYAGSVATLGTIHSDRAYGEDGFRQCRQMWEMPYESMPRVSADNEPIGQRSSVRSEADPIKLVAQFISDQMYYVTDYCWHTKAGVWSGGKFADPGTTHPSEDGSSREPGNLFEEQNAVETAIGFSNARKYLPEGMVAWTKYQPHWNGHPFFDCLNGQSPWTNGDGFQNGCWRCYGAVGDGRAIALPLGLRGVMTFKASYNMDVDVIHIVTGDIISHHSCDIGQSFQVSQGDCACPVILCTLR